MKVSDVVYGAEIAGTDDFQFVVEVELGSGYHWDSLVAWWSPSKRKFFWLDGGGCSCDYLGMGVSRLDQFGVGNRDELTSAVRQKYDQSHRTSTGMASSLLADLASVKTFRAVK